MWTNSVLCVTQPGWDEVSLSFLVIWTNWVLSVTQPGWLDSVFPFVKRSNSVLSVRQLGWDQFSLSFCDVNQFSTFCYTTRLGWVQVFVSDVNQFSASCYTTRLGWVQSFLLWCEPFQYFLLHKQVGMSSVFSFVMWTKSVLSITQPGWDEFSLSFCDVNQCSAFCYTTRLG